MSRDSVIVLHESSLKRLGSFVQQFLKQRLDFVYTRCSEALPCQCPQSVLARRRPPAQTLFRWEREC